MTTNNPNNRQVVPAYSSSNMVSILEPIIHNIDLDISQYTESKESSKSVKRQFIGAITQSTSNSKNKLQKLQKLQKLYKKLLSFAKGYTNANLSFTIYKCALLIVRYPVVD